MRRVGVRGISLLALLALATACGSSSSSTKSASSGSGGKLCPNGTIIIGNAKGLTGPLAPFDGDELKADELAVSQINQSGGIDGCKFKMIAEDTKSDPAVGRQVAQDLLSKGAQILLVPGDFDFGITAAQAAEQAGKFSMSPTASTVGFPQAVGPNFFMAGLNTDDIGKAQATFAKQKGWKTVYYVVNTNISFFTAQASVFAKDFGGTSVGRSDVTSAQQDYSTVVSKIAALHPAPDVIYGSTFFPNIGIFIKQLRQAGVNAPILGSPGWASRGLPTVAGPTNLKNAYYIGSVYFEGPGVDPSVAAFEAAYKQKYGTLPSTHNAILGYQAMRLLFQAIKSTHSTGASALASAFKATNNVKIYGSTIVGFPANTAHRSVAVIGFTPSGGFRQVETFIP